MKKIQILFIFIFLCTLAIPLLFFKPKETISTREKRTLAAKPQFISESKINWNYPKEAEAFINDHFGFRVDFLEFYQKLMALDHKSLKKSEFAISGKDGWIFLVPDHGSDFGKENLFTYQQVNYAMQKIQTLKNWFESHGIKFILVTGPNKHNIYEEYYPFPRPQGKTNGQFLYEEAEARGLEWIFPYKELLAAKKDFSVPLYYETDSHWNSLGANIAANIVISKIKEDFPNINFPNIEYSQEIAKKSISGDMVSMLGLLDGKSTEITFTPKDGNPGYKSGKDENGIFYTDGQEGLPRALIYRDSFYIALEPFLAPMFSHAESCWRVLQDSEKEYILNYKPDIVIYEFVERYLPAAFAAPFSEE